jgi:hypothetical protein
VKIGRFRGLFSGMLPDPASPRLDNLLRDYPSDAHRRREWVLAVVDVFGVTEPVAQRVVPDALPNGAGAAAVAGMLRTCGSRLQLHFPDGFWHVLSSQLTARAAVVRPAWQTGTGPTTESYGAGAPAGEWTITAPASSAVQPGGSRAGAPPMLRPGDPGHQVPPSAPAGPAPYTRLTVDRDGYGLRRTTAAVQPAGAVVRARRRGQAPGYDAPGMLMPRWVGGTAFVVLFVVLFGLLGVTTMLSIHQRDQRAAVPAPSASIMQPPVKGAPAKAAKTAKPKKKVQVGHSR